MKMNQKLLSNKKHWFNAVWPGEIFWRAPNSTPLPPYITYPPQLDHIYEQSFKPLIMATMSGNAMYVKTILSSDNVDLDFECNVIFDGLVVYGATALWVAASLGHLQIVKLLVENGANVNHNTKAQSSPLRAACYADRLDIVKYLIEHGASVNLSNEYNNTCIMIAAYRGHADVVLTLLKHGANPNQQALCGATALHYAAECGHLEVCRLLLDHGAYFQQNELGLSPILNAAERTHEEVVDLFIKIPGLMSKKEIITALELMGASFANDKEHYSISKAYAYLRRAMEMRYSDKDKVLRKKVLVPVSAYDDWFETENLAELQAIFRNHHFIHMESLTIRERILGRKHPNLTKSIEHRCAVMADQGRLLHSLTLWNYVIDLRMMNNISVEHDLLYSAQLFSQILRLKDVRLDLSQVLSVLVKCQLEIERNKYKILHPGPRDVPQMLADQNKKNGFSALYLIKILAKVLDQKTQDDTEHLDLLYKTIKKFIKCDIRFVGGQTLLHMAVNGESSMDNFHTSDICTFPCFRTSLLLVHAGASVVAVDDRRNTPLHTLVASSPRDNPKLLKNAEQIVKLLVHAGAHLDAVNGEGLTPAQVGHVAGLTNIIQGYGNSLTSLKCIASRCVAVNKIKYQGVVPALLESYIEIHSSEKVHT